MFIYAIGTNDKQKIGFSKDPSTRLNTLQTSNSEQLEIHYTFEVEEAVVRKFEKHIHKENSHKRLRGEWFDLSKEEVVQMLTYYEIMSDTLGSML